jgi:hypothetical protein
MTHKSNENKMSDGGRERASLAVKVWKSFQEWSVQRSAVRSIAWLDRSRSMEIAGCDGTDKSCDRANEHCDGQKNHDELKRSIW